MQMALDRTRQGSQCHPVRYRSNVLSEHWYESYRQHLSSMQSRRWPMTSRVVVGR
jgi:hypothetical protein